MNGVGGVGLATWAGVVIYTGASVVGFARIVGRDMVAKRTFGALPVI